MPIGDYSIIIKDEAVTKYFKNGVLHRTSGPAWIKPSGMWNYNNGNPIRIVDKFYDCRWYYNGIEFEDHEEWLERLWDEYEISEEDYTYYKLTGKIRNEQL